MYLIFSPANDYCSFVELLLLLLLLLLYNLPYFTFCLFCSFFLLTRANFVSGLCAVKLARN
jgi:hypothetical protein